MSNDHYFSIGQAGKICNLSVQSLRFYDKIGLVIPSHTDNSSGYRYYSNFDLLNIKIVQDMKALNFSLEEIKATMNNGSLDCLIEKLEAKRKSTIAEITQLERIVESIGHRTNQIGYLQELGNELKDLDVLVELKQFPKRYVLYNRRRSACGMDASIMQFTELFQKADANGLIPKRLMTVYHENIMTFDRNDSDLEFCITIDSLGDQASTDFTRIIPGGDYITALYCGIPNAESCKRIYSKLLEWIERNHYMEIGPSIEQYLVDMAQMMKPEEFIVELQVSVQRVLTL
ncbi:MerR family transcriptional regulator [Paenibacillus sp. SYP-B3998]|uniref:MerR family transcriptional regulator n=2 Tax=Paenibacillus sp. SYP-B3998 TaxID=2678564 RepID=A0A6G4A3Q4_9BACL|nr:MerR family transcriptional regulator [Paenibacillus sp. SYP-B3998]